MPQTAPLAEHAAVAHALSLLPEPSARLNGYELVTDCQSVVTAHERGEAWATSYRRPFAGVWVDAEPWSQLVVTKVRAHQRDHCSAEQHQPPPLLNDMPGTCLVCVIKHIDLSCERNALIACSLCVGWSYCVCSIRCHGLSRPHLFRTLWEGGASPMLFPGWGQALDMLCFRLIYIQGHGVVASALS